jgi:hypothetical protein
MTDSGPRRWLLLSRETSVANDERTASWYVDHLFVDQDGVPTLVEVKRGTDTRVCREVIGQMLDYAANVVTRWSVDELRGRFLSSRDASARLDEFLNGIDPEEFWSNVSVNLAGGRIRMVFVADIIPPELRRVVDFLAEQMKSAEVFAVEVRKYEGGGERALVPRLVSHQNRAAWRWNGNGMNVHSWKNCLRMVRSERKSRANSSLGHGLGRPTSGMARAPPWDLAFRGCCR